MGYNIAVALHVIIAVLGSGQIGAIAVMLIVARRNQTPLATLESTLAPLLRLMRVSLGLLVLTGVWMDVAANGALHSLWWVRVSFVLVVVAFALVRRMTAGLARGRRDEGDAGAAQRGLEWRVWSLCAIIGLIAILMRAKPF
jgi:hypothetical protein